MPEAPEAASPAVLLLELGHRARLAASLPELEFLLVNDTRLLAPYRQAALWREAGGVAALSGVVQPDRNAPYAHGWRAPAARADGDTARAVSAADLPDELVRNGANGCRRRACGCYACLRNRMPPAGGLLAGADPVAPTLLPLLTEWSRIWCHAWRPCSAPGPGPGTPGATAPARVPPRARLAPPGLWAACALLAAGAIPVRLSVLAPGELVAAQPAVLRAPLDGVVAQIHVQPNQIVKQASPVQPGRGPDRQPPAGGATGAEHGRSRIPAFAQMALGDPRSRRSWRRWPARSASAGPSRPSWPSSWAAPA